MTPILLSIQHLFQSHHILKTCMQIKRSSYLGHRRFKQIYKKSHLIFIHQASCRTYYLCVRYKVSVFGAAGLSPAVFVLLSVQAVLVTCPRSITLKHESKWQFSSDQRKLQRNRDITHTLVNAIDRRMWEHCMRQYLNEERCWCECRYMTHICKSWHAGRFMNLNNQRRESSSLNGITKICQRNDMWVFKTNSHADSDGPTADKTLCLFPSPPFLPQTLWGRKYGDMKRWGWREISWGGDRDRWKR